MADLSGLLAASSSAPIDWVYGALASIVFVVVIAVPAACSTRGNTRSASASSRRRPGGAGNRTASSR